MKLKNVLLIVAWILFLPIMLLINNILTLTDEERSLAPFSFTLHAKSRAVLISLVIYAFIYYWIFTAIFK